VTQVNQDMTHKHIALAKRSRTNRSRVSNGRAILEGVDGRSPLARRYTDIVAAIASDQGGADRMSESRMQLVRRMAGLAMLAESAEAKLVNGSEIDILEHCTVVSTMTRVCARLGLSRLAKQIPALADYLQAKDAERVEIIEPASFGSTSETR
jgi:hypothetical protein